MKLYKEYPEKKIAVLNFASAINPGGGVLKGASAQEECLCRCSTLYEVLNQDDLWEKYYNVNRARQNSLYTDACIYSPGIVICKSDTELPERLRQAEFVSVDVITCAAPKLSRGFDINEDESIRKELYKLYCKRISHILHIAAANKADILVLGAFGCGAFHNDPDLISKGFCNAMIDYLSRFDLIEFAIYCKEYETQNYEVFRNNLEMFL